MDKALSGLYCITDPELTQRYDGSIETMVEQAILGGTQIIQYRDKHTAAEMQLKTARSLARLCHDHEVMFLVNDDPQLALDSDADGVHIGQTDGQLGQARELLGPDKIIGVTCHSSIELALNAEANGADYVAFGRFFPSQTKPDAPPTSSDILLQLKQLSIPVVAIGGIQTDNAEPLLQAGVQMLAVIHAVFGQPDIRLAAQQFTQLFENNKDT